MDTEEEGVCVSESIRCEETDGVPVWVHECDFECVECEMDPLVDRVGVGEGDARFEQDGDIVRIKDFE